MEYLTGKCAYEGVVIEDVYLDQDTYLQNEKETIAFEEVEKEIHKLEDCLNKAENSLISLKRGT